MSYLMERELHRNNEMGNLMEELLKIRKDGSYDRYINTKVGRINDMVLEGDAKALTKLLNDIYKDGYEEGYLDCSEEMK